MPKMTWSTLHRLLPVAGLLFWAECGGATPPTACVMECTAMSGGPGDQLCGTDGKTYNECEWDCEQVPAGVEVYPGACEAGKPAADSPPYPADGKKVCDWKKVAGTWTPMECAAALGKTVTGDMPKTLDGQMAMGTNSLQMSLPAAMQPDTVDHRIRFGAAKNQGEAGSCTAFGAVATLESSVRAQLSTALSLSEMHLWARYASGSSQDSVDALRKGGVVGTDVANSAGLPYDATVARSWEKDPNTNMSKATPNATLIAQLDGMALYQVGSVDVIEGTIANKDKDMVPDVAKLKTAIAEGRDVTIALFTSDSFMSPSGDQVSDFDWTGKDGHAVSLVGYRTSGGKLQFLIRNSYGNGWGTAGYAWIHADNLQKHIIHAFTVAVKRVGVDTAPTCPTGQAADLGGVCRMVCADGSVADSTNTCKPRITVCPTGQTSDLSGTCVAACVTGTRSGTGWTATCTDRACTFHVNDGVMGCMAGAGKTCDKTCSAPDCQITTGVNEMGKTYWTCTGTPQ